VNIYDHCSHIGCGSCKYFQVDADRRTDTTCKRINHKEIKFSKPFFKSYDCGQLSGIICSDYTPAEWHKWLYNHWKSIDDYCREYEEAENRPRVKGLLGFCLDDDTSVRYYVYYKDFYNNTFLDEAGNLKWVERQYYKQVRSGFGYKLITEKREV